MMITQEHIEIARKFLPDGGPTALEDLARALVEIAGHWTDNYPANRPAYQQCDAWNAQHPVGSRVTLQLTHDRTHQITTASLAWVSSKGRAVVRQVGSDAVLHLDSIRVQG